MPPRRVHPLPSEARPLTCTGQGGRWQTLPSGQLPRKHPAPPSQHVHAEGWGAGLPPVGPGHCTASSRRGPPRPALPARGATRRPWSLTIPPAPPELRTQGHKGTPGGTPASPGPRTHHERPAQRAAGGPMPRRPGRPSSSRGQRGRRGAGRGARPLSGAQMPRGPSALSLSMRYAWLARAPGRQRGLGVPGSPLQASTLGNVHN